MAILDETKLSGIISVEGLNEKIKTKSKLIGIIGKHAILTEYENYIDCKNSCTNCKYFISSKTFDYCINKDVVRNYINYHKKDYCK